jgi:TRAP-type mannitol/chloroaromatic compound transport system permease small subunit
MKKVFRVIDAISDRTGHTVQWLSVALVGIICFETILHIFNRSTLWEYETVGMIGATMYALSFAYVLCHKMNVRVDVIFTRLPRRAQAAIDGIGMLVAFFPLMGLTTYSSIKLALNSWIINEKSAVTGWYPPAAPLRTIIAIGFVLLLLQGVVVCVRELYYLIRNKTYE